MEMRDARARIRCISKAKHERSSRDSTLPDRPVKKFIELIPRFAREKGKVINVFFVNK
jgi:hypothetical protein